MRKNLFLNAVSLGCFVGFLAGCSGLNSQFDCPMEPGVLCKSLDQVNTMVDQGKLGTASNLHENVAINTDLSNKPVRIWVAAYEDNAGTYYSPTTVYPAQKNTEFEFDKPQNEGQIECKFKKS